MTGLDWTGLDWTGLDWTIVDERKVQISAMMLCLGPDCLRDVVSDYLQSQTPSTARHLLGSWCGHWRSLAIFRPLRLARARGQRRHSQLREVFISTAEFSQEDRASMLSCFSR